MIESMDVVVYTAVFLVPGFFINEIIRHFVPLREKSDFDKTISSFGYSILELALWYWFFIGIIQKYPSNTYKHWLFLIIAVLFTSVITAVFIGLIRQNQVLKKISEFFDIHIDHPVPTGWDYKFSEIKSPRWVCICLDNDTYIRGKYGTKSLASSEHDNHDIYLEEVYIKGKDGSWELEERTDGIWISAKVIKWINFYTYEVTENEK